MNKKTDVMLINPYDENALKNALGFITPPTNLMYLASSLEKESYSVKIVDDDLLQMGYEKVSELAEKLKSARSWCYCDHIYYKKRVEICGTSKKHIT